MPIDFGGLAYKPQYDTFARKITFYPLKSQPSVTSYDGRGIFDTREIDVVAVDGSIVSERQTILDILESEFTKLPLQKDRLFVPADGPLPEAGMFEVSDGGSNGYETTLQLRRVVTP